MARQGDNNGDDARAQRWTVRDGYDGLADDYLRERESNDSPDVPFVESFLSELKPDARLLDVGCGQGTPVLNRLPVTVDGVGVDFSTAQLGHARERTNATLLRGDMTSLPVGTNAVDAVTALHSIIHVPLDDHPTVYQEFARVLRPGGRLLLTADTGDGWAGTNDDWLGSGERMEWSFPGIEETRNQLRRAGFRVTDERTVDDTVSDAEDAGQWLFLTAEKRGN